MENTQQNIYFPQGTNAAPIYPLKELKEAASESDAYRNIQNHTLTKELKKKYDDLIGKDKEAWREMVAAGKIIALFIEGEQIVKINTFNGMPYIDKANRKNPMHIRCISDMQYFCTSFLDKWRSSKPDIVVVPYSNADEAIAQARKANAVVDYLEGQFFKNWFVLNQGLDAQIWGWYGTRVRPDFTSKSFYTLKKILGEKEVAIGKGYGRCECGYKGNEAKQKQVGKKTFDACPKCESLEYDYDPPIVQLTPYVKDREKIFLPEIVCERLRFPSTRWDLSKRFEESSWGIVERTIEEGALRRIIGNIRFPEGESGNDFGLDAIESLAKRGAAMNGSSSVTEKDKTDKITLSEMYLSVDDLWDIRIGGEEKTVEGQTLPKGKRMSEVFPNGCCVIGINGMSLILGIYSEHHSESVTSGVLHMKPESGAGRGVQDAVEVVKQKNRRYSQIDAFFASRGTPATLMAENAIEPQYRRQLHNPRAIIPIKIQNFPEFKSLDQFIKPLQGESVPGDLVHVTFDRLREMMQTAYHITDLGGARPMGVKNDTATFAEIVDSNADALFSPALSINAEVRLETIKKGFYKWTRYTPEARFIPFRKPSRSGTVGEEISGKDVNGEYQWSYQAGSEAPKTRHTEMQKRASFFSMFAGGIEGWLDRRKINPKEIAEVERDFDVNFESESYDLIGEVCRERWEVARQLLPERSVLGQPNYFDILLNVEPSFEITEPAIGEQMLWFQQLLMTEEGRRMKPEERKLVSAIAISLKELAKGVAIEQQRDAAEIQLAAQEPAMEAQAAQMREQAAMQAGQQAQAMAMAQGQAEEEKTMEVLSKVAELADADTQREHEAEIKDKEVSGQVAEAALSNQV